MAGPGLRFPHLAQRVFNVPLAIHPGKAEVIIAALAERLGVSHLFGEAGRPVALMPMMMDDEPEPARGYEVLGGVAIIPVEGTLVAKLGTLCPYSGMTGYDGIRVNFLTALADDAVRAIVLDIDSPGGECSGLFDLVDTIVAARGVKPVRAILTEVAFSAAYAIASAADRISVPRTGGVGSIGVVCMHVDWSRALTEAGATVTMIRFGERKFEGNQYEPLSRSARAAIQADVDAAGELFVETVARNRGLSVAAVSKTEAATFLGPDGVALGLADVVEAPDEALRALFADLE
jgi:capsid assembly protease